MTKLSAKNDIDQLREIKQKTIDDLITLRMNAETLIQYKNNESLKKEVEKRLVKYNEQIELGKNVLARTERYIKRLENKSVEPEQETLSNTITNRPFN